jgi:fucose permease
MASGHNRALLVTVLLSGGLGWRLTYGSMAAALCVFALVLLQARRSWQPLGLSAGSSAPGRAVRSPRSPARAARRRPAAVMVSAMVFAAVETGIESGAGIWGYVFLTAGRGLPHEAAGLAVAAYWAMMFVGRGVLGPVAEHAGTPAVLVGAVTGVSLGAALMAVPGPGFVAVIGLMTVGLAAAPIFPLFTLATAQWAGTAGTADVAHVTRTASLQVAASTIGSAVLPAGLGLLIGAVNAAVLAPSLLGLALAMCALHGLLARLN